MADDREHQRDDDDGTVWRRPGGAMMPLVVAAIVIAGLYVARPVLQSFVIAVLLSLLLAPGVSLLQRRGLGRAGAVTLTVFLAAVAILGFAAAVGEQAVGLARDLPRYEANIADKIGALNGVVPGADWVGRVTRVFRDIGDQLSSVPREAAHRPVPVELQSTEPVAFQIVGGVVGPLLARLASAGLVLLLVVLILLKREDLRDRVLRLAGPRDLHRTTAAMNEAAERLSSYLLMQLAAGVCYGVPVGVGLAVIGIPDAFLWGILGVVLRFIPYLGGPLTAVLPVILAVAAPGWAALAWTVLLFVAIEAVLANIVEPLVYGRTTGLSAVAVVLAAAFWAWLWGVVGLLLATPLTVCLVVLGRYVPHLQFLDILLGNQPVLSPPESLYQRLLARDPEEAAKQAEEFTRARPLAAFLDEVAIPALALAQRDNERGALAPGRRAMIAQSLEGMLDNLAEDRPVAQQDGVGAPILCLAGRDELDLAAAWLLQHLLFLRGYRASVFAAELADSGNLDGLPLQGVEVVCLSLLEAGSAPRARYLIRRIRRRTRRASVLIGCWGSGGPGFSVAETVAATAADKAVTTLAAAVAEIAAILGEAPRPALAPPSRQPA